MAYPPASGKDTHRYLTNAKDSPDQSHGPILLGDPRNLKVNNGAQTAEA
jgi:hypothetical protein